MLTCHWCSKCFQLAGSLLLQFNHLNALHSTKASLQSSLLGVKGNVTEKLDILDNTWTPKLQWIKGKKKTGSQKKNILTAFQYNISTSRTSTSNTMIASRPENDCNKAQRARNERQHTAIPLQRLQIACCLRPWFKQKSPKSPKIFSKSSKNHKNVLSSTIFSHVFTNSSTSKCQKISLKEIQPWKHPHLLKSFKDVWHCLLQQRAKDSHLGCVLKLTAFVPHQLWIDARRAWIFHRSGSNKAKFRSAKQSVLQDTVLYKTLQNRSANVLAPLLHEKHLHHKRQLQFVLQRELHQSCFEDLDDLGYTIQKNAWIPGTCSPCRTNSSSP